MQHNVKITKPHNNKGKKKNYIDVLVKYKIDGKQKVLVVEDKIFTGEHDNQIIRYVEGIKEENKELAYDAFSCTYYKTGHIFNNPVDEDANGPESEKKHLENIRKKLTAEKDEHGEENKARIRSFKVIGLEEICNFFGDFKKDFDANDILQNYVNHIENLKANYTRKDLPSVNDSKFELKENLDIWMNFYDSIYKKDLVEEFKDLKFPFYNYHSFYAAIEVESSNFDAPRIEIRSREPNTLYCYFYKKKEKTDKSLTENEKKFLQKYNAKYNKNTNQFFKIENIEPEPKATKEDFKNFIKKVADFYQKTVNEIYGGL